MKKSPIGSTPPEQSFEASPAVFSVPLKEVLRILRECRYGIEFESQLILVLRNQQFPFQRMVLPKREKLSLELVKMYWDELELPPVNWEKFASLKKEKDKDLSTTRRASG